MTVQECSLSSTPSPAFIVCRLFDKGHSDQCEMISHCGSDLHFSNNERCWASFHVLVSHLYVLFEEMSLQVPFPLFDRVVCLFVCFLLVLSCMSWLYILEINSLSVVSLAIIFSHSEGCLFSVFVISFVVQNLLSLIRSHLFIFVFISITLSSVQFSCSVVSDSLQPDESQHTRPPCPSPSPGGHKNSCSLSWWCHLTISSSVIPFSSCHQSFPASGSFPMSQLFTSGGQSTGVSASAAVLPMKT